MSLLDLLGSCDVIGVLWMVNGHGHGPLKVMTKQQITYTVKGHTLLYLTYIQFPIPTENPTFMQIRLNTFGRKRVFATVRRRASWVKNSKWHNTEQSSPRKGTSLARPLPDRMGPNVQKCISCTETPVTQTALKIYKK